jgi:fatty acid desaturase
MKLRFAADSRTLLWAFVLFPAVVLAPWVSPHLLPWTVPLSMYVGFCAGIFAHNHNHCPTFHGRAGNAAFSSWVSLFYGYPIFAWIPTHNFNHHKFQNRPGDASITWRISKENSWLVASTYPFVAAVAQGALTGAFVRRARTTSPRLHRQILVQVAVFVAAHGALFATAVALRGWRIGLLVWAGTIGASMATGLWGMMFINFIQRVHCDPWSEHDHSRNFTSRLGNFFVFNAGYHAAHHEHPGAHWSRLPQLHAAIAPRIHPALCQASIFGFCLRVYLLGALAPRFRTRQVGRPACAAPA